MPNNIGLTSFTSTENSRSQFDHNNNNKEELNNRFTRLGQLPTTTSMPVKYEVKEPMGGSISSDRYNRENYNDKISQMNMIPKNTLYPINKNVNDHDFYKSNFDNHGRK